MRKPRLRDIHGWGQVIREEERIRLKQPDCRVFALSLSPSATTARRKQRKQWLSYFTWDIPQGAHRRKSLHLWLVELPYLHLQKAWPFPTAILYLIHRQIASSLLAPFHNLGVISVSSESHCHVTPGLSPPFSISFEGWKSGLDIGIKTHSLLTLLTLTPKAAKLLKTLMFAFSHSHLLKE